MNCLKFEKTKEKENTKISGSMQEESLLTCEFRKREHRGKIWRSIRALLRTKGQVFPHWCEPQTVSKMKNTHTHTTHGRTIIKFLNIKGMAILKASTEKNRSQAKHQKSKVALYFSTFIQKTMRQWRMCLKFWWKIISKQEFHTQPNHPSRVRLK